ncbi:MAG: GNAT family N-acetyltransferase [Caldilineaceae bacterium]|nr:GNAT family N-acetyltransferase [Caldilineaceae bacterium]
MAAQTYGVETHHVPFDAKDPRHLSWAVELWGDAIGSELPLSQRFLQFNLREDAGVVRGGRIALVGGRPAGFVLCSAQPGAPRSMRADVGWLDAIAVAPPMQRQGIGTSILRWAEGWISDRTATGAGQKAGGGGAGRILVGGSLRPFTPGVLVDTPAVSFLLDNGYVYGVDPVEWDVARNLSDYVPPPLKEGLAAARPAQPGQEKQLLGFLEREFPGRWH